VKRIVAWIASAALFAGLAVACVSDGRQEWVRADGTPESPAVNDLRSQDRAVCATKMGAPVTGSQSAMSYSRTEVENCMRARGWRKASD
jgi:hypothetical protein